MVFFSKPKVQVARLYAPLKLINFFADDGYSLESRRLEDEDVRLSFEDESDYKGKGIYGCMPEAAVARSIGMASGRALDYNEDSDMDDGDAS